MTLLFDRPAGDKPVTHAFVIGVGNYPHAKPGQGALAALRSVRDVPSAADSAKYISDWLLTNRDQLEAPLASLEVLISDPVSDDPRYDWQAPALAGGIPGNTAPAGLGIDRANAANVELAAERWFALLKQRPGDVALFYCSGHGASLSSEQVLFLDDLNRSGVKPWIFANLSSLGRSLRQNEDIAAAYLFVDACGEKLADFELSKQADTPFFTLYEFGKPESSKVMLITAACPGLLAFDATLPGSAIPIGRFTQTLVKALDGASIRDWNGEWAVCSSGLQFDLKLLKQFCFPGWRDQPFEPLALMTFNEDRKFAATDRPVIPVLATLMPPTAIATYRLYLSEIPPPPPGAGTAAHPVLKYWTFELKPQNSRIYAVAVNGATCHFKSFMANQPQFRLQVRIP